MTYQLPSDPAARSTIKKNIQDCADSLLRIDAERQYIRETAKAMKEDHEMPVALFNSLARARFKQDIKEKEEKAEMLTDNYSLLFPDTTSDAVHGDQ